MSFPSVSDRVRVTGRDGEFIIVRVHPSEPLVDVCGPDGRATIETDVPVHRLAEPIQVAYRHSDAEIEERLLRSSQALAATRAQLDASRSAIAALHDRLRSTEHLIRSSEECIQESNRTIRRAHCEIPPWDGHTE